MRHCFRSHARLHLGVTWLAIFATVAAPTLLGGVLHALVHAGDHASDAAAICATGCEDPGHHHAAHGGHACPLCTASRSHSPNLLPQPLAIWSRDAIEVVPVDDLLPPRFVVSTRGSARAPPVRV